MQSIKEDVMCDRLILSRLRYCYYYTSEAFSSSELVSIVVTSVIQTILMHHFYFLIPVHLRAPQPPPTTSRFFWRLRKFHEIYCCYLEWERLFVAATAAVFGVAYVDWGCIIVKAVAVAVLLLLGLAWPLPACKKGFVSLTMVVSSDATAAISLLWLWVAFMLLHRRAFTTTSGVNDSLIIDCF